MKNLPKKILAEAKQTLYKKMEKNMLNLFTNSKSWVVASLFVATAAFGQDGKCAPKAAPCAPKPCVKTCPCPAPKVNLSPAYNAPATPMLSCSWDVSANASFIYWQAMQENMELGFSTSTPISSQDSETVAIVDGDYVNMNFNFKPGFKVGFGFATGHDDWDLQAEYTWFHARNHKSVSAPASPGNLIPLWTGTGVITGSQAHVSSINETWRLNMDLVDLNLGRTYYVGTKLTMRPSFGARAAFINQKTTVVNENNGTITGAATVRTETDKFKSKSWGVGAAGGLETNWDLGDGFRLFSNGAADLLFTRYTSLSSEATITQSTSYAKLRQRNVNTMRTHLDIGTGVGYGTYLDCNKWYFDISAGYEFQVFFDQNMFRFFSGNYGVVSNNPNGNLYIQGLTLKMELDF